jgi:hypothetical protein
VGELEFCWSSRPPFFFHKNSFNFFTIFHPRVSLSVFSFHFNGKTSSALHGSRGVFLLDTMIILLKGFDLTLILLNDFELTPFFWKTSKFHYIGWYYIILILVTRIEWEKGSTKSIYTFRKVLMEEAGDNGPYAQQQRKRVSLWKQTKPEKIVWIRMESKINICFFPVVIFEVRLVKTVQSLPSLLPMKKTKTYHNFDDCTHINKAHEYIRCWI